MIRTRLTLWNSVMFAFAFLLIGSVIYFTTRAASYQAVDRDLLLRATFLERSSPNFGHRGGGRPDQGPPSSERGGSPSAAGPGGPGGPGGGGPGGPGGPMRIEDLTQGLDPIQAKRLQFSALIIRPRVMFKNGGPSRFSKDKPFDAKALALSWRGIRSFSTQTIDGHSVRVYSILLPSTGRGPAVAQFAANLDDVDATVTSLRTILLSLFPIALVVTSLLGIWLTNRALRPVREITDAAEQIEAKNLSERLPVRGDDEFATLSSRFNSMLERIEGSFQVLGDAYEAQRRFVADASHELKTPLTTIKGRVGIALMAPQTQERYAEHLSAINRAADTMSAIVRDLLLLAKSDEAKMLPGKEPYGLQELVEDSVASAIGVSQRHVEIDVPKGILVCVDPGLMSRVIVNVVANALRHTSTAQAVRVTANRDKEWVVLRIEDEGEGIPKEHVPFVFDRFHRVDASRNRDSGGTGLGLAIAKSVVKAHGGTIELESEVGIGATVIIRLPGDSS